MVLVLAHVGVQLERLAHLGAGDCGQQDCIAKVLRKDTQTGFNMQHGGCSTLELPDVKRNARLAGQNLLHHASPPRDHHVRYERG